MMIQISRAMRRPLVRTVVSTTGNTLRGFSSREGGGLSSASSASTEWRKKQLDKLENKFQESEPLTIESEEDLQPMWKSMESRVKNRRPRTKEELGGRTGRTNIKRTDEEMWLQEGLYDHSEEEKPEK
jgi:hypothetical protein